MSNDWVNWLDPVRTLAVAASERIMAIYATAFGVVAKDDHSPLTAADLASNHAIVAGRQVISFVTILFLYNYKL